MAVLKGVSMELCGTEYVDLKSSSIKIYGIYFSYNKRGTLLSILKILTMFLELVEQEIEHFKVL